MFNIFFKITEKMSPIPNSNLIGHKKLHDRVYTALDRCHESQGIDFKESATWESLKWKLIKTLMAMGNLRDGGIIIIGVSERGENWELSGIDAEHLSTYNVDNMLDIINKYASPHVDIEIVLVEYRNGLKFLALQAHEFSEKPYICKKNAPDDVKEEGLFAGSIFIRPPGKPQTKKIASADELHDLLELAAEKHARRMIEISRRIGFEPREAITDKYDDELEGL